MTNAQNATNPTVIFGENNPLSDALSSLKANRIVIVSAFASKTEDLIRTILRNENNLTLIIGTINHFTDPDFIKECVDIASYYKQRFDFYVDFRGNDSIHWKLYLVGPSKVFIGSANFTRTGLSMQRDTAISIKDNNLYTTYNQLVIDLRQKDGVVNCRNPKFQKKLADYERNHRKVSAQNLEIISSHNSGAPYQPPQFADWIKEEHVQVLPIFIWGAEVNEEERDTFDHKVKPLISTDAVELIGIYEGDKEDQKYFNGNIVLTVKYNGGYASFNKIDISLFTENRWWLCNFSFTTFQIPFMLTPEIKRAIKLNVSKWISTNKTYLTTNDLRQIAAELKKD